VSRFSTGGLIRAAVFLAALVAFPFFFGEHWVLNMAIFTLMYAGLASAWNIIGGYTGYISLGNAAFFGIGAYAVGIIFTHIGVGAGYRPFYVLPLVGVGVAIGSIPVAWIALRTRAATFAIVTITLLFVVQQLAFNLRGLTGGSQGLTLPIPPFPLAHYEWPFYYAMLGTLCLALLASWYVRGSRLGLHLFSIRDDEDRARGIGVPVTSAKVLAFCGSAGLTAMIGGVWAYYISFIYPQFAVDPLVTIGMVLMVYLGGKGTIWGPVVGAFVLVPAQQYLAYRLGASELYLVGYAAVFLGIMLVLPRGILPSLADMRRSRKNRSSSGPRWRAKKAEAV
jgi:branched-chain amino acid transport system permease protein